MKRIIMIAIVILNFILQTSLYPFLGFFGIVPNISLILVVIFAIYTDSITGAVIGLITGLLYDIMIMDIFGINALLFFISGAILGAINEEVNKENSLTYVTFTLLTAITWHGIMYVILYFLRIEITDINYILKIVAVEIILDCIFAIVVWKLMIWLFEKFNNRLSNW